MNIKLFALIITLISYSSFIQNEKSLVKFTWILGSKILGTIDVPANYKLTNSLYGEGIVTTLKYPDNSTITLHFGGNMQIPFCKGLEFVVTDSTNLNQTKIRSGYYINNKFVWSEHNSFLYNIMYYSVPVEHKDIFNMVLSSFKVNQGL